MNNITQDLRDELAALLVQWNDLPYSKTATKRDYVRIGTRIQEIGQIIDNVIGRAI